MILADILNAAKGQGLGVHGVFHPGPDDLAPTGTQTLALLGPDGPAMWAAFRYAPESKDGGPDPLDRWSKRVVNLIAAQLGAEAVFPSDGPPWPPFQRWATRIGAVVSPVGMQATEAHGLWISFRAALALRERLELPKMMFSDPCTPCSQPCRTACPVDAFASGSYDVQRCIAHVRSEAGIACRDGCLVRKSCPAGQRIDLPADQRAFHMAAFLAAHSG